ncbi:hypothetical protein GQ53DRAFT_662214 [Thozetella sp. PMI_491]|nr:hypothetical protein GQ53DRAFT_662214 [Thozetella sp. PMI_491]
MARYLTPAKIGLLSLVELYSEAAVPNDAIVPVLSFLTSHILDGEASYQPSQPGDHWQKVDSTVNLMLNAKDFEKLLGPIPSSMPGRRLWDKFLDKLWAIDSLHALHDFFDRRLWLLAKTKEQLRQDTALDGPPIPISRNSPLGTFLRQSHLEFTRLPFHNVSELWNSFVIYREPTARQWKRRHPGAGRLSFDTVLANGEDEWGPNIDNIAIVPYAGVLLPEQPVDLPVSTDEVESLLEFQIRQMQQFGNRVPTVIRERFRHLIDASAVIPSLAHYIKFLDAWRSGDYSTSFDYLYRYFDYTMQNRDRAFYQYALMNLAIVQSDFGCHREAVAAMLETVSVARENKDMTCLNFALNWLFHFGRGHPELVKELETNSTLGNGKENLAYLRVKAKESYNWALWSSALLSEAKMGLSAGDSMASAFESMVRSSQILVEHNMKNMFGAQSLMAVTLWDRLGLPSLSEMSCEVFLRCHKRDSVFDDEMKIICRLSGLLAGRGRYSEAFEKLENLLESNAMRSWKPNQYWHKYRGLLKLRRDLHRGNLDSADILLSQLLQSRPEDLDPDLVYLVDMLHIEALTRHGDLSAAFAKVEDSLAELRDNNKDIALRVRLLLHKAHLFDRAGRPQKGFTIVMRAASMAWRARLIPLLWHAIGALANVLTSLGEFTAATSLLLAVLPRCLECDTAYTSGLLYSLLADAYIGQAGDVQDVQSRAPGGKKQMEFLNKADGTLDLALKHFSAVEDVDRQCEMLAKKATVMRVMGNDNLAEDCAAKYLALRKDADMRNE